MTDRVSPLSRVGRCFCSRAVIRPPLFFTALHITPMSCTPTSSPTGPRKRTSSFSTPNPHKIQKMGSLRRTASYITLPDLQAPPPQSESQPTASSPSIECSATVSRHCKDQRSRRHKAPSTAQFTIGPPPTALPNSVAFHCPRASSPLAPSQKSLPPRASFPRSKHTEPDLYRVAITTRMRCSPEGQKILTMGPRLAVSILTATRELEHLIAAQIDRDNDVQMMDGMLNKSWVVVEDWDMVDCCS